MLSWLLLFEKRLIVSFLINLYKDFNPLETSETTFLLSKVFNPLQTSEIILRLYKGFNLIKTSEKYKHSYLFKMLFKWLKKTTIMIE